MIDQINLSSKDKEAILLKMLAVKNSVQIRQEAKASKTAILNLDQKLIEQVREALETTATHLDDKRKATQNVANILYEIGIGIQEEQLSIQSRESRLAHIEYLFTSNESTINKWADQVDTLGEDIATGVEDIETLLVDLEKDRNNLVKYRKEYNTQVAKEAALEAQRLEAERLVALEAERLAALEAQKLIEERDRKVSANIIRLNLKEYPSEHIYKPSKKVEEIFEQQITLPVKKHPKTVWKEKILLGYSGNKIRKEIIKYGRADFTLPYEDLSAAQRVLLYCYYNMKKHYFSSYSLFERLKNLKGYFVDNEFTPLVIDIGCGPGTSLLALGDCIRKKTKQPATLNYIGIDIARSMLNKAKSFSSTSIFSSESNFKFYTDWNDSLGYIKNQIETTNIILINASYLFASESLDVESLGSFINKLLTHRKGKPVYFLFQNPNTTRRNVKYLQFKEIVYNFELDFTSVDKIKYQNISKPSKYPAKSETVKIEVLSNI